MDWVKALEAAQKPKDPTADLGAQNEADLVANALESTASVAFDLPTNPETKNEALIRASKQIANDAVEQRRLAGVNAIKTKITENGIDPIALGITMRDDQGVPRPITKEEWEGASDARWVEKVATAAALEYEKQVKQAWQQNALKPAQHLSSTYDPLTMRDGRIMSSTGMNEETRGRPTQIPANAASIFDPFKLDRFAETETSHDKGVREKREANTARAAERKADLNPKEDPNAPAPMNHSQIVRSGAEDAAVFQQRAPKNQVSMLDISGTEKLSALEIKEKLSQLFTRVEDNGQKIRDHNQQRKIDIQGKKETSKERRASWEELKPPTTTKKMAENLLPEDLTKRLSELFTCPQKPDGQ
jgi:hypothetical protein